VVPGTGTGERNFVPFVPWIAQRSMVVTVRVHDSREAIGINTPEELATVEQWLRTRGAPGVRVLSIVIPAYNEERFIATLSSRFAISI
jgi:hypothetical protein